jgi:hypothetical protein
MPLKNTILVPGLGFPGPAISYPILAGDASEDWSSADAGGVQVDDLAGRLVGVVVGNPLGDALVRAAAL